MALQIRRGTNAERQLIIPLQGELIFTTDTKRLYIGDGTTQGGIAVDLSGAGAATISGLSDVVITSVSTGQVLKWNGSAWVNSADNAGTTVNSINDITDVVITSPSTGQVLKFDGTNWVNGTDLNTGTGSLAIENLTNVTITTPTSGQVLKYNGTGWVNGTDNTSGGGGATALIGLSDVAITTPTSGQVLKFDGTNWVNGTDNTGGGGGATALTGLSDVAITTPTADQLLKFDGTNWVNTTYVPSLALDALTNVSAATPVINDVLKWNGVSWINQADVTGILQLQEDLAPKLGANLDLNSFDIIGTGNIGITGTLSVTGLGNNLNLNGFNITGTGNISLTSTTYDPVLTVTGVALGGNTSASSVLQSSRTGNLELTSGDTIGVYAMSAYNGVSHVKGSVLASKMATNVSGGNFGVDTYLSTLNQDGNYREFWFRNNGIFEATALKLSPLPTAAIATVTPAQGGLAFDSTLNRLKMYNGSAYEPFATVVSAPATATSAGTPGQIAYDSTHIYVCIATNSWIRSTAAAW